jgi:hypothetical protein
MFSRAFGFENIIPSIDLRNMDDCAALFQSGYLTVDSIDVSSGLREFRLKCPNTEVSHAIVKEFIERDGVLLEPGSHINSKYGSFIDAFDSMDEELSSFLFSSCIAEVASHLASHVELVPQVMMFSLLNMRKPRAKMEENVSDGRIDLIYRIPGVIFVIEIKYDKPGLELTPEQISERLDVCVSEAFDQISAKQYVKPYFGYNKTIYAVAVGVHAYSDAKIRFRQKIYKNGGICDIET